MKRETLENFLNETLTPELFNDYGPNGLQIEGQENITKVAFAVSATKASIEETLKIGAQALIVHHGLFWKFHGPRTITKAFAKRVIPLVKNEINLFGYHLPLDAHPKVGNAAGIAKFLELQNISSFGDYKGSPTGLQGEFKKPMKPLELKEKLQKKLDHNVLMASPDTNQKIKSIGIITGGANGDWALASKLGLCAYLTGEMSEHDWHESQENGVHMFAGGHNATEQFGVIQLKSLVEQSFPELDTFFIRSENPA